MKKKINLFVLFLICLLSTTTVLAYKCPNNLDYVGCGSGVNGVTGIPAIIPRLISFAISLMKVIIPVALIITGTIEMFKSIISGNPDNIPKGKKKIINKFVAALLAFFIISFTTNIVKLIAKRNERSTLAACLSCYLNNNCNDDVTACGNVNDQKIGGESNDGKKETIKDNESQIQQRDNTTVNNGTTINNPTVNNPTVNNPTVNNPTTPTPDNPTSPTNEEKNTRKSSSSDTARANAGQAGRSSIVDPDARKKVKETAAGMGMPSNVAGFISKTFTGSAVNRNI